MHLCVFYFFKCLDRTEEKGKTNHLSGLLFPLCVEVCLSLVCFVTSKYTESMFSVAAPCSWLSVTPEVAAFSACLTVFHSAFAEPREQ